MVNRLQRELETVLSNYRILEKRLEAEGIDLRSISQLAPLSTDTECVAGPPAPGPGPFSRCELELRPRQQRRPTLACVCTLQTILEDFGVRVGGCTVSGAPPGGQLAESAGSAPCQPPAATRDAAAFTAPARCPSTGLRAASLPA